MSAISAHVFSPRMLIRFVSSYPIQQTVTRVLRKLNVYLAIMFPRWIRIDLCQVNLVLVECSGNQSDSVARGITVF